jgi:hypothetical protein
MEISRPNDLGIIANLGLTLPEAKQLLARVQQAVVAAQARDHAVVRPDCSSCGGRFHVKDRRLHQIATLFGRVTVRLPRLLCTACGRIETGMSWPSHCRSTPELDQLQGHLSALTGFFAFFGRELLRSNLRGPTILGCQLEHRRSPGRCLERAQLTRRPAQIQCAHHSRTPIPTPPPLPVLEADPAATLVKLRADARRGGS